MRSRSNTSLCRFRKHLLALSSNMFAVAQSRVLLGFLQQRLKLFFSRGQRQRGQILAVEMEEIEDIGDDVFRLAAPAQCCLQRLETAFALGIENDGLHVQHCVLRLQFFEPARDSGKTIGPVVAVAGTQADGAARNKRQETVAVKLDFMHPLNALRRLVNEGGQLHLGIKLRHALQFFVALCGRLFLFSAGKATRDLVHRASTFDA